MNEDLSETKTREEAKRERACDPVERWQHIQEAIAFAEANLPPNLRRNRPRLPAGWYLRNRPQAASAAEDPEVVGDLLKIQKAATRRPDERN